MPLKEKGVGKTSGKKVLNVAKGSKAMKSTTVKVRNFTKSYTHRAVKQRSLNSVLHKAAMENARKWCAEQGWGAARSPPPRSQPMKCD